MDIEKIKTIPPRETLFLFWNSVRRSVYDLDADNSKLTEDHENRIRRHYDQLLSNLNVPDVVTQMFKSGKLTAKEHEHIRQFYSTPIRASEELLNIVIMKSRDVYECFLESLKRTKQHHLYQMLICDEATVGIGEHSGSEHFRLIRQNYDWLTESLDPDSGLLSTLYAKEVLNQREYGQVVFEKDRFVKNEILLSIISRKSVDNFKKFISSLNENLQEHISKRLTETAVGDATKNVAATVEKTFTTTCPDSLGKRIPPKIPPKPKKQPPLIVKPEPLLEQKIQPSKPNQIEKQRQIVTKHEKVKKQSADSLQAKFRGLPNELQTEVSTKIFLVHRVTSKDSILKISFTKILEESRNVKGHNLMQAKAAEEKCEILMEEIYHRDREFKIMKEDTEREKTRTKKQLRELQETLHELDYRLISSQTENKVMLSKLKKIEVEIEVLKVLNKQKEQEANKKVSIIEKLEGQVTNFEIKLKETEAQLMDAMDKLIEKDLTLKATITKLEETKNENENLFENLECNEFEVESLTALNRQKEQDANEKVSIIEKLDDRATYSEAKLKETEAQLKETRDMVTVKDLALKASTTKMEETEEKLKETETKYTEFQAKLILTEKCNDNLSSEDIEAKLFDLKRNWEEGREVWTKEKERFMNQVQELQHESSAVKDAIFDLKQKLEQERKVWKEEREQLIRHDQEVHQEFLDVKQKLGEERKVWKDEKEHLIKHTQELQMEISDERKGKYKSDLVLVQTIGTKASKEKKKSIHALTILDKEMFVVSYQSSEVEVYDSTKFSFSRQWTLTGLIDPLDIGSCSRNKCLYIFDCKGHLGQSSEILRVDLTGKPIKNWSTPGSYGGSLSVTNESNVILTVINTNKLNEYLPGGQLIREINLSDASIRHSRHAIKLTNGNFLVCHGRYDGDQHRVCVVDADGKLKKSFGGKPGSTIGQMNRPVYMSVDGNGFVMVADCCNSRVLLLDSDLDFKREILSKEGKHGLRLPERIVLDESNNRLIVADNHLNYDGRILIFDFK